MFPNLRNPVPDLLERILRDLLGPDLGIQRRLATPNIRLTSLDEARPLDDLPDNIQDEENRDTDISRDKVINGPAALGEDRKAVEENNDGKVDEREPSGVRLPLALEDERVAVHALGLERGVEADVGDANAAPGEELGYGGEVLEPSEDVVGASRDRQVGEQTDRCGGDDAVDWDTGLGACEEETGRLAALGQCEEVAGAGEEEGVCGGGCRGQDDGVDDGWEGGDTGAVDGNDPWGVSSAGTTVKEI